MNILIRQETTADHPAITQIIKSAFKTEPFSDQTEHLLVARLRKSEAFIPELSLVAELNGEIVGHILLTKIQIRNETESYESLALAPVSVAPVHQGKGIGGKLILKAHSIARELGFSLIILLGHAEYYPRFGYQPVHENGIRLPFEAPPENCMVVELRENALREVNGIVEYDQAFFG